MLAEAYNNLGVTQIEMGKFEEAELTFLKLLELEPNYPSAYLNLGNALKNLNKIHESGVSFRKAARLDPKCHQAYNNLGVNLLESGILEDAEVFFRQAIDIKPDYVDCYVNLGLLYKTKKEFSKAEQAFRNALEFDSSSADAQWGLALLKLKMGNFDEGFRLYEMRYADNITKKIATPPKISIPQYQGTNLTKDLRLKKLLVCPEQGVGDEVMFSSLIPELDYSGDISQTEITLACDHRLVDLFRRSFDFINVIPKCEVNQYHDHHFDYWMFLGSLPLHFRNSSAAFKNNGPYLVPDETLLNAWRKRFNNLNLDINVGISWKGGSTAKMYGNRSMSLNQMLPILSALDKRANIISLQYGDHQEEIKNFSQQTGIKIYDWTDSDPLKDLDNFSAQIKALDLVISIDNSTVHFSGALGTKTFVMLPFDQDWRWTEGRENGYWYPNVMTLFRQKKQGYWYDVTQKIVPILNQLNFKRP